MIPKYMEGGDHSRNGNSAKEIAFPVNDLISMEK